MTNTVFSYCIVVCLWATSSLYAVVPPLNELKLADLNRQLFPVSYEVEKRVRFWQKIFIKFPSSSVVVHDSDNPQFIIDIIDFELLQKKKPHIDYHQAKRDKISQSYLKRYRLALKRFKHQGKKALRFGSIEKRIYHVYRKSHTQLKKLYSGKIEIRTQTGLADEFLRAIDRSQKYIGYMEKIFKDQGVPYQITRLAFVESMFNTRAQSKFGASGVWQFMRQTAKQFLLINNLADERNSPLKATKAAARLLHKNYQKLKSWPLAITAYNHGRAGMERAVKKVKSRNMSRIINFYKSPTFGYASKNFYAEFIAAARVYEYLKKNKKKSWKKNFERLSSVVLNKRLSIHEIITKTSMNLPTLKKYNSCLRKKTFSKFKYYKLPKAYELFMPSPIAHKIVKELNNIFKKKYASITHRK